MNKPESRFVSLISFLGALVGLGGISYFTKGYQIFFNGDVSPFGACSFVVLSAVFAHILVLCGSALYFKRHPTHLIVAYGKQNVSFLHFFVLTILEEIIARWLFVGVLPQHLPVGFFYPLLMIGNAGYLFVQSRQLDNMPPHPLKILPHFFTGLFCAFVFIKFGLMASILTNFGIKSILMTLNKVEDDGEKDKDFWQAVLCLCVSILGLVYTTYISCKSPWVFDQWLAGNFKIEGWNFWDYFATSLILIYGFRSVCLFLQFDQGLIEEDGNSHMPAGIQGPILVPVFFGLAGLALLGLLSYFTLYLVNFSTPVIVMALSLILCSFYHPVSGSARVRNFWNVIVMVFISVAMLQALDFAWIMFYIFLHGVLRVPCILIERIGASYEYL